jgi:hypothetical protein
MLYVTIETGTSEFIRARFRTGIAGAANFPSHGLRSR